MEVKPNSAGPSFHHYDITLCLKSNSSDCFTRQCTAMATPDTTTCTISDTDCAATNSNCLRGDTLYTAVAVGVEADNTRSAPSNVDEFRTLTHE